MVKLSTFVKTVLFKKGFLYIARIQNDFIIASIYIYNFNTVWCRVDSWYRKKTTEHLTLLRFTYDAICCNLVAILQDANFIHNLSLKVNNRMKFRIDHLVCKCLWIRNNGELAGYMKCINFIDFILFQMKACDALMK